MDVAPLTNTTAVRNMEILSGEKQSAGKSPVTRKQKAPLPGINKEQLKAALDKLIRNTRFQYVLIDELSYLAVRIIDRDTDKVIKEIPSRELQKIHKNVERALGILFDELI